MAWEDSDRKDRLPPDWKQRVAAVLRRCGGRCEWKLPSGARCPRRAADVDHKRPGDDHRLSNLQGLCAHHHGRKSAREGNQARWGRRSAGKRPPERHPGDLGGYSR